MRKITKKKRISSAGLPFFTFLATLFIILAILVLAISNFRIHQKRVVLQGHIEEKESELEMLKQRMDQLRAPDGPGDDFMIERAAREQLLLKRPGEEVVFITFPEAENLKKDETKREKFIWWNPFTWIVN